MKNPKNTQISKTTSISSGTNINFYQMGPQPKNNLRVGYLKPTCPFKTGGRFCTHIANGNLTNKRKQCLYYKNLSECPYLKLMKEEPDVLANPKE